MCSFDCRSCSFLLSWRRRSRENKTNWLFSEFFFAFIVIVSANGVILMCSSALSLSLSLSLTFSCWNLLVSVYGISTLLFLLLYVVLIRGHCNEVGSFIEIRSERVVSVYPFLRETRIYNGLICNTSMKRSEIPQHMFGAYPPVRLAAAYGFNSRTEHWIK